MKEFAACRVHISVSLVVGLGLRRAAGEGVGPGDDRQGTRHHAHEPQVRHRLAHGVDTCRETADARGNSG